MKFIIGFFFIASITSIILGYVLNIAYSEKLIGFGVLGLFLIVIPLFSYHSWKDKDVKEYMLNKENLEKMREREKQKKN